VQFAWDRRKASTNLRKHGIAFDDAVAVFSDPLARIILRSRPFGRGTARAYSRLRAANYLLFVSFTERDGNVRLISARRATTKARRSTAKERHAYETYLK
jgi:hypothetical protein